MKTIQTLIRASLCAAASLTLAGCLTSTPHWDETFGSSVSQLKEMQTLNPNAGMNTDPVAGVDGSTAHSIQKNYAKSFTTPPPPINVFAVGLPVSN
ncbi:hypothetical protein PTKU46_44060 [Paraburkholderia terrae]|uniref:hypothetical protein n=1 Tax=Paraburkholderia terrae TaxID=311230 RepID=UPI0030DEC543